MMGGHRYNYDRSNLEGLQEQRNKSLAELKAAKELLSEEKDRSECDRLEKIIKVLNHGLYYPISGLVDMCGNYERRLLEQEARRATIKRIEEKVKNET